MDESYMREYFERNQEVFYMRFRKDESKWALEKERAQAVDSFREKYVHGEAMEADFEAMVNAIWNDDYEAHVLMFLYGACYCGCAWNSQGFGTAEKCFR